MKTYLIELKLKDTETIDWKKGLASYLRRSYGSGQWSQFYDEKLSSDLNHLRNNANGELALESLLEQNYLYYAFLEQLHLRLGSNSTQLRLDFIWYDAEYNPSQKPQKYSQHTLALEKSSIIYNIGAILTQVAKEKLNEDYKASVGYLSKAVACFEYLSENFLNSPSVDLHAENTKFLADLSHAEAQELFLLKLINGTDPIKQASLISKLAYSAVCLYEKCSEFFKESEDGQVGYGDIKWRSIITCKTHYYKAVTAYYYGLVLEQQNKFGEAIAFLKLSSTSLLSSLPFKTYLKDFIDFQSFKETLEDKQRQLMKDNDYIYHDSVLQSVQLEVVKPMDAIKSPGWPKQLEPYMDQVAEKCDRLFKGIVPIEIYEKESIYSEEKANLLRKEMNASETANWEYRSFIEFTNLPKLINDLEKRYKNGTINAGDDPQLNIMRDQISNWAKIVQNSEFKDIDKQMKAIITKRQEILGILPTLSEDQKDNVVKLKSALVEASQSDEKLFSLVKPFVEEIKLLNDNTLLWKNFNSFNVESLKQPSLLDLDDTKAEKIYAQLKALRQLAEDLKLLKEERSRNLEELKEETSKDDITKVLLFNREKSESELRQTFNVELEKFKPFSTRIEATIFKQTSTINEIKFKLDEIFKLSGVQDKSEEELRSAEARKKFFDKLQEAMANFDVFCSDLLKGLVFYDSLLKMSKDLLSVTRKASPTVTSNFNSGPPVPPQYSQMQAQLRDLSFSEKTGAPPLIPPRTYGVNTSVQPTSATTPVFSGITASAVPPVPPKHPKMGVQDLSLNKHNVETEERELQQNPTSFYDRPSVFDENLYSKFSG